jgi:hypothetical protein
MTKDSKDEKKPDPKMDPKFEKVVQTFLKTPTKPHKPKDGNEN